MSLAAADQITQRDAAGFLAAPLADGKPKLRAGAAQSDPAVLYRHERDFALAAELACDRRTLDQLERGLHTGNGIGVRGTERKGQVEFGGQPARRETSPGPRPKRDLVHACGEVASTRGDNLGNEVAEGEGQYRSAKGPTGALDFALEPRSEPSRIGVGTQCSRRGRVSGQRARRIALPEPRLDPGAITRGDTQ